MDDLDSNLNFPPIQNSTNLSEIYWLVDCSFYLKTEDLCDNNFGAVKRNEIGEILNAPKHLLLTDFDVLVELPMQIEYRNA